jgi:hypothetical protein
LLVPENIVLGKDFFTLTMEAKRSMETYVLHIPKDGIRHGHSRENPRYYIALTGWVL